MKSPKELHAELEANTTLLKILMYERGEIKNQLEKSLDATMVHAELDSIGWESDYIRNLCTDNLVYLKTNLKNITCKDMADYLGINHSAGSAVMAYAIKHKLLGE